MSALARILEPVFLVWRASKCPYPMAVTAAKVCLAGDRPRLHLRHGWGRVFLAIRLDPRWFVGGYGGRI